MTTEIEDLLGLTEIAEMYGVHKQTVNSWRRSSEFPTPRLVRAMGPLWDRKELVAWRKPENGDFRILIEDKVIVPCAHCKGATRPMEEGDVSNGGRRNVDLGITQVEIICIECSKTTLARFAYSSDRGVFIATDW